MKNECPIDLYHKKDEKYIISIIFVSCMNHLDISQEFFVCYMHRFAFFEQIFQECLLWSVSYREIYAYIRVTKRTAKTPKGLSTYHIQQYTYKNLWLTCIFNTEPRWPLYSVQGPMGAVLACPDWGHVSPEEHVRKQKYMNVHLALPFR